MKLKESVPSAICLSRSRSVTIFWWKVSVWGCNLYKERKKRNEKRNKDWGSSCRQCGHIKDSNVGPSMEFAAYCNYQKKPKTFKTLSWPGSGLGFGYWCLALKQLTAFENEFYVTWLIHFVLFNHQPSLNRGGFLTLWMNSEEDRLILQTCQGVRVQRKAFETIVETMRHRTLQQVTQSLHSAEHSFAVSWSVLRLQVIAVYWGIWWRAV